MSVGHPFSSHSASRLPSTAHLMNSSPLWFVTHLIDILGPPKHWDDVVPYWIGGYKSKGCCWTTGQKEDEKMKVIMARERRFHEINHFFSSCHLVAVRRLCVWLLVGRRLPSYFAPPIATQLLCSMHHTERIIIAHSSRSSCLSAADGGRWNGAGRLRTKPCSIHMFGLLPITASYDRDTSFRARG